MGSYLNPGTIEFQESLNSEIYIDKTGLIEKTNAVLRTKQKFVCISRPRRFGKSMAADMLAAYYERGEDAEELFANFAIGKAESFQKHLNQYDVLKINMQEFLSATQNIDEMLQMLKKYLIFDLKESYGQVRFRDEENLVQVMKDIYTATKHAFVILIDEWDCLFREYRGTEKISGFSQSVAEGQGLCSTGVYDRYLADKEIRFTFCVEYVYGIFYDRPGKYGRIFWIY